MWRCMKCGGACSGPALLTSASRKASVSSGRRARAGVDQTDQPKAELRGDGEGEKGRDDSPNSKLRLGSEGKKPLAWSKNARPENLREGKPGQPPRPQGAAPSQAGESPKPLGTGTRPRVGAREAGTPTLSQQSPNPLIHASRKTCRKTTLRPAGCTSTLVRVGKTGSREGELWRFRGNAETIALRSRL